MVTLAVLLGTIQDVKETLIERVDRLIGEAVAAGTFRSHAQVLIAAGLSSGWLSEGQRRLERFRRGELKKEPTLEVSTAAAIAAALQISIDELVGETERGPSGCHDEDPDRAWAVVAARALHMPESAIQAVMSLPPLEPTSSSDESNRRRWWWFKRIEAESSAPSPTKRFGQRG